MILYTHEYQISFNLLFFFCLSKTQPWSQNPALEPKFQLEAQIQAFYSVNIVKCKKVLSFLS